MEATNKNKGSKMLELIKFVFSMEMYNNTMITRSDSGIVIDCLKVSVIRKELCDAGIKVEVARMISEKDFWAQECEGKDASVVVDGVKCYGHVLFVDWKALNKTALKLRK